MDGADAISIHVVDALSAIAHREWDALANPPGAPFDPFLTWDFLQALEESVCVSPETGWSPAHIIARDRTGAAVGAAPNYLKAHSYGEYVFDHAWADAYNRAGGRYYPKLQCAIPFTPVPGRRLLTRDPEVEAALAQGAIALAQRIGASSIHVTFASQEMCERLAPHGFLARAGLQYHWFNRDYQNFEAFLSELSSNKRKNLRKERARAQEGLTIKRLQGPDITHAHWDFFFRCYMDTGARKWGAPYLDRQFFELIGDRMADKIVLFIAEDEGAPIASALNFIGADCLYGRYWGAIDQRPFLHFELCYYQAIEFAIEHRLARVEAGAQGEHKLLRGYEPVTTWSAHWIAHPQLRQAIAHYLRAETPAIADEVEHLAAHTPFKKNQ